MKKPNGKLTPKQVRERFDFAVGERRTWEYHWQEVTDMFMPDRNDVTVERSPGDRRNLQLLDNTGIVSSELLAGHLHGMLTNPSTTFFGLTSGNEEIDDLDDVRMYLQNQTRKIHLVLNNSNFQTEVHQYFLDLVNIGTAPWSIEEDDDDVVRFASRHIKEVYAFENNKGVIDEVYRRFKWNIRQIVAEWGEDVLTKSDALKRAYERSENTKFEIINAVYPRSLTSNKASDPRRYISQYVISVEKDIQIHEGFYREHPLLVPRWSKASGEVYGRSPAMKALPDAKTLNKMTETTLRGAQKTVDPPLQLPDDGFIGTVDVRPAGLNYYRSGTNDRIEPIFNDARIDFGFQAMNDRRQRVRTAFYIDQLQLASGPQMTATESLQRTEEQMRYLGPTLGRQQSEFLRPTISRVFEIMQRKNMLDEPPEALRGLKLDVVYTSMIAKAQKVNDMQNIQQTMAAINPFVAADQTVLDNFDGDVATRVIAKGYNFPQEILRTVKNREKIRKARAEAEAAALAAQQEQQQAENLIKGAPAVAKLDQSAA